MLLSEDHADLIGWAAPKAMVTSRPELLTRAMSGFMVPLQMSVLAGGRDH